MGHPAWNPTSKRSLGGHPVPMIGDSRGAGNSCPCHRKAINYRAMRVLSAVLALLLICTVVSVGQAGTETQQPSSAAPQAPPSDQKPAAQRVRVSQGVAQGLLIHKVSPVYPRKARDNGIQGTVVLKALIGKDGLIKDLTVVSGPQDLASAAIGAVQQWQYRPYLLMGQPVEVETNITVNFTLQRF